MPSTLPVSFLARAPHCCPCWGQGGSSEYRRVALFTHSQSPARNRRPVHTWRGERTSDSVVYSQNLSPCGKKCPFNRKKPWARTHLVSFGFHDVVHHGLVVSSRLHTDQLVAGGPAVLQSLLPRLVLLHQNQIFPQTDEGETGVAVLGGHLFSCGRKGHTVAVFHRPI